MTDLKTLLQQGIDDLSLVANETTCQQLIDYIELLEKWNQTFNLTAIRDPRQMVIKHLLDSLSIAPYVNGPTLLDVGTGAGLPGIPLAILMPDVHVHLIDNNHKKTRFLKEVIWKLKLANTSVTCCKIEDFNPDNHFQQIVSRAFSSLHDMIRISQHCLSEQGDFLAMKGRLATLDDIPNNWHSDTIKLTVPFLDEQRHLIRIKRS